MINFLHRLLIRKFTKQKNQKSQDILKTFLQLTRDVIFFFAMPSTKMLLEEEHTSYTCLIQFVFQVPI